MSVWTKGSRAVLPRTGTLKRAGYGNVGIPWPVDNGTFDSVAVTCPEDALRLIAIRTATDLFASLVSELPLTVFSGAGIDRKARPTPGYLDDPAGDGYGRQDWLYQLMVSWLLRGNAHGEILSTGPGGYPLQVDLWYPDRVSADISSGKPEWSYNGKPVQRDRVLHARVNPIPGVLFGLSVIGYHAQQIGLPISAVRYGLQFFSDGAHPTGILQNENTDISTLTDDQVALIKARFMAAMKGTREPALVGRGWSFNALQVAPEESQFLATIGASEAECCKMFGAGVAEILGYPSGAPMTYSTIEGRMSHLLILSLDRWITRAERLLSRMLPRPQYVVLDRDSLLSSTTLARYQSYESALRNGWQTINEVRAKDNLPPVEWGDQPYRLGDTIDDASVPAGNDAPILPTSNTTEGKK
jgi:HK97 family phage portal protein